MENNFIYSLSYETMVKDFIYDIKYGGLEQTIDNYDIELIKKALLVYVNKTNNCFNLPYGLVDEIIEKIEENN